MGTWGRAWRLEEVQVVLGHASRTTTERYARLAPDSIRRVANEATEQWSDHSKVAPGLVNDWSLRNSPYIQVPEMTEPPIGFEPRYAPLLRSPTVYETVAGGFAMRHCVRLSPIEGD